MSVSHDEFAYIKAETEEIANEIIVSKLRNAITFVLEKRKKSNAELIVMEVERIVRVILDLIKMYEQVEFYLYEGDDNITVVIDGRYESSICVCKTSISLAVIASEANKLMGVDLAMEECFSVFSKMIADGLKGFVEISGAYCPKTGTYRLSCKEKKNSNVRL